MKWERRAKRAAYHFTYYNITKRSSQAFGWEIKFEKLSLKN
nr:MAG TPA: hypothetical protein [Caudoviricetes sp.]